LMNQNLYIPARGCESMQDQEQLLSEVLVLLCMLSAE
jgi:hypothetical protein